MDVGRHRQPVEMNCLNSKIAYEQTRQHRQAKSSPGDGWNANEMNKTRQAVQSMVCFFSLSGESWMQYNSDETHKYYRVYSCTECHKIISHIIVHLVAHCALRSHQVIIIIATDQHHHRMYHEIYDQQQQTIDSREVARPRCGRYYEKRALTMKLNSKIDECWSRRSAAVRLSATIVYSK